VDWGRHLTQADQSYLSEVIDPTRWYPMTTFERLGNAILFEIAGNDVEAARLWGKMSVSALRSLYPTLVAPGDAVESLMRFRVLRATFFDFPALDVASLEEGRTVIQVGYHMGRTAEEAAAHQTMGFFEGVLELAGATAIEARFAERGWEHGTASAVELRWTPA
jgi:hypothetical protein